MSENQLSRSVCAFLIKVKICYSVRKVNVFKIVYYNIFCFYTMPNLTLTERYRLNKEPKSIQKKHVIKIVFE